MAEKLSDALPSKEPPNNFFSLPTDSVVWRIWHGAMKTANMVAVMEFTRNDNKNCISIQNECLIKAREFRDVIFFRVVISPDSSFDEVRADVGGVHMTPTILILFYKDVNHLQRKTFKGYDTIMEGIQSGLIDKKIKDFLQERILLLRLKKLQEQKSSPGRADIKDDKGKKEVKQEEDKGEVWSKEGSIPNTPSYEFKTTKGMQSLLMESRNMYSMSLADFEVLKVIYVPPHTEETSNLILRVKCNRNGSMCKGKEYAMKVVANFFTPSVDQNKIRRSSENEYLTLSQLPPHENIIQMWAFFYDICEPSITRHLKCPERAVRTMSLFILMDEHPINMEDYLKKLVATEGPSPSQVLHWVVDLLSGLQFLYEHKVIHRDLKLDNLLLSKSKRVIINDFGKAIKVEDETFCVNMNEGVDKGGNEAHLAPEILTSSEKVLNYSKQSVWAAGVLAYELSGHENPFIKLPFSQNVYEIGQICPLQKTFCSSSEKCQQLPKNLTDIVKKMLDPKYKFRPTLKDCINALCK